MTPEIMAQVHAAANRTDRAWRAEEFAALLASPHVHAFGDIHAIALVRIITDEAELLTIATAPAHQREGRARALMNEWHAHAIHSGARTAFLEVAADNESARALYSALGYSEIARRRGYYARQGAAAADAVIMRRPLRAESG